MERLTTASEKGKKNDIMHNEIRKIDLVEWQLMGEGGMGKTYVPRTPAAVVATVTDDFRLQRFSAPFFVVAKLQA